MSENNTNPNNTNQNPNEVAFNWHGVMTTVAVPDKRPHDPKKPNWLLSVTKPLTYAQHYEKYLEQLDEARKSQMAFDLAKNPQDRPNLKKAIGLALGGLAVVGGGAAVLKNFTKSGDDTPALIESSDSTVE